MFAMVKAIVPRYRYDQLMRLGWKVFLPLSLFWVVLTAGVLVTFGWASMRRPANERYAFRLLGAFLLIAGSLPMR